MTALIYRLLATVLIEMWYAISTYELLTTVLMQKYHSFRHINYLLPSRLGLKRRLPRSDILSLSRRNGLWSPFGIETKAVVKGNTVVDMAKGPVEPIWG